MNKYTKSLSNIVNVLFFASIIIIAMITFGYLGDSGSTICVKISETCKVPISKFLILMPIDFVVLTIISFITGMVFWLYKIFCLKGKDGSKEKCCLTKCYKIMVLLLIMTIVAAVASFFFYFKNFIYINDFIVREESSGSYKIKSLYQILEQVLQILKYYINASFIIILFVFARDGKEIIAAIEDDIGSPDDNAKLENKIAALEKRIKYLEAKGSIKNYYSLCHKSYPRN